MYCLLVYAFSTRVALGYSRSSPFACTHPNGGEAHETQWRAWQGEERSNRFGFSLGFSRRGDIGQNSENLITLATMFSTTYPEFAWVLTANLDFCALQSFKVCRSVTLVVKVQRRL